MIGNILKLMLTRGLTMKRWNNFPRIEDVTHLDNVGYVIHVALFLSYIEEKNGNKVDREFLIKRIIFNSFSRLILSDINSGTREYILKVDDSIFDKLEKKAVDYLLGFDGPEYIKKDIIEILENTDKKLELTIIDASKQFAGFGECVINSKVFPDMYDVPLNQIRYRLDEIKKQLKSIDILLANDNYKKYLAHIRRLSHSMRWNQQTRTFPISVMSHLVVITFIAYILGMIENQNGANYNIEELVLRTIYHDIPEAITGDIITPTKKAVEGFEKVLEEVEIKMMDDYIFSYVDTDYKSQVFDYMLKPFEGDIGKLAKNADILSALFEAKVESNFGSESFAEIYRNIKKVINKYSQPSIDYVLKNVIDSFDEKGIDIHLGS
ncbi:MAG: HD domain-containing protein [Candidatus Gracilibacteria bacterium]|nr:HD domain-containing protein [Candidatus Gracilibacteria bacterium]